MMESSEAINIGWFFGVIAALGVTVIVNYLLAKHWVFAK